MAKPADCKPVVKACRFESYPRQYFSRSVVCSRQTDFGGFGKVRGPGRHWCGTQMASDAAANRKLAGSIPACTLRIT